jgi:hypothetical protein
MRVKRQKGSTDITFEFTERKFEKKAEAIRNHKGRINYKNQKIKGIYVVYQWGYANGKKRKNTVTEPVPEHSEYYYNGIKLPKGFPFKNKKKILDFIAMDLMEKYEFYAYELGYDKPHNLRSVTLKYLY